MEEYGEAIKYCGIFIRGIKFFYNYLDDIETIVEENFYLLNYMLKKYLRYCHS